MCCDRREKLQWVKGQRKLSRADIADLRVENCPGTVGVFASACDHKWPGFVRVTAGSQQSWHRPKWLNSCLSDRSENAVLQLVQESSSEKAASDDKCGRGAWWCFAGKVAFVACRRNLIVLWLEKPFLAQLHVRWGTSCAGNFAHLKAGQ